MNRIFSEGEIIFKEGDPGDCFYDIIDGRIGIYVDYGTPSEQKLTEMGAGHIIGELALLDSLPRSATAVALSSVSVEQVDAEEVEGYFDRKPDRITYIFNELGERLTRLTADYREVCETLREATPSDQEQKPGIMDKIKKFAAEYQMKKKTRSVSQETQKALEYEKSGEGFSKNVNTYKKGDIIFREGEPGRCMYNIHTGSVNIYAGYGTENEELLTTVGVGHFFGEMALVGETNRTATAVSNMDQTMVESMVLSDFEELYSKNPLKIRMTLKHMAERVRVLTNSYVDACGMAYQVSQAAEKKADPAEVKLKVNEYLTEVAKSVGSVYIYY